MGALRRDGVPGCSRATPCVLCVAGVPGFSGKQKNPRRRLFCWRCMRTLSLLLVLLLPLAAEPKAARSPWLLFPIDVRRFDHVSSKFGLRRLDGRRRLPKGVDLVAPAGSYVVAAREGMVADAGRARACGWYVTVRHANACAPAHSPLPPPPPHLPL